MTADYTDGRRFEEMRMTEAGNFHRMQPSSDQFAEDFIRIAFIRVLRVLGCEFLRQRGSLESRLFELLHKSSYFPVLTRWSETRRSAFAVRRRDFQSLSTY
ncbi:MAG: hypothetical protein OSA84_08585 [Akkermansiaceae bacterium]|nr:hypothetical protein [Akkermansiaceae bacterium]